MKTTQIISLTLFYFLISTVALRSQEKFPWPIEPFNQSHVITGNFAEYRSTSPSGHFHNGTDIPKPDRSNVYPVKDGKIVSLVRTGGSAYVRVDDKAYVHILPNQALDVGDSVFASQTVIGTILNGSGHVHFTNGFVGSERNSMLMNSGLTPLVDPWPPIIRFIRFYRNNTSEQFYNNQVTGLVDIVAKVDEQNGPPGYSTSVLNNGTYKIGYKILTADTGSVVYEPPNNGLRFQFDTKPSNNYVNIVYFRDLSSTTSHVYQVTNDVSRDNYWDTTRLPEGDYVVMVFTEDTRQNRDTMYARVSVTLPDLEPPAPPTWKYVMGTDQDIRLAWFPNTETDLAGYRLYFSFDNQNWSLFKDETVFTPQVTDTILPQVLNTALYFRLTAVDNSLLRNESAPSDIYGMSNGSKFNGKVLIVDGFDRTDGTWTLPYHDFSVIYGKAILENNYSFDTVPNESIEQGIVDLNSYEAVIWFVGDEDTTNETISEVEQSYIRTYLENGGKLFISGANIAYDLSPGGNAHATASDLDFLNNILQVRYFDKVSTSLGVFSIPSSIFGDSTAFQFGQTPYLLDSTDAVKTFNENAEYALFYINRHLAAIQYEGTFGSGTQPGKLVYFAFPFETIKDEAIRNDFMGRILNYFFGVTAIKTPRENIQLPTDIVLYPGYPNPFNPQTNIEYYLPQKATVRLEIYNILGQRVRTLFSGEATAGKHRSTWKGISESGEAVASGIYLVRLTVSGLDNLQTTVKQEKIVLAR